MLGHSIYRDAQPRAFPRDNGGEGKESEGEDRSLRERAIKCTHESFSALSTAVGLALWFNCLTGRCEKREC